MGLIKIFSGKEDLAVVLQTKIETAGVKTTLKNNNQTSSGKLTATELFIEEVDFAKANPIIEEFRMSL